jgi:HsdM N-terminal domain
MDLQWGSVGNHGLSSDLAQTKDKWPRFDASLWRVLTMGNQNKITMALKKSELYSSLWSSCDELRGGMDASQYKDYVLVFLFIKYISDRYAGVPYAPITIPQGASFKDMVALKGKPDIGDQINKKIIGPLANANKLSDFPDFNDAAKKPPPWALKRASARKRAMSAFIGHPRTGGAARSANAKTALS